MGNEKVGQEAKSASSKVRKGESSPKRGNGIHKLESVISKDGQPNCSSSSSSNNLALPVLNPVSLSIDYTRRDTEQVIANSPPRRRRHIITYHPTSSKDVHNRYPVPSENVRWINRELFAAEPLSNLPNYNATDHHMPVTSEDARSENIDPDIKFSLTLSSGKMSAQRKNPCYFDPNISNARSMQQNNACPEANKNQTRNFWKQTGGGEKENGGYQNGLVTSGSSPLIRQSMQPLLPTKRYQTDPNTNLSSTWSSGKMSTQRKNPSTFDPNILNTTSMQQNNAHSDGIQNQTRNLLDQTSKNGGCQNQGIVTSSSLLLTRPAMQPRLPSRQYLARMETTSECTYDHYSEPILHSFFPVGQNIIEQEDSNANRQIENDDVDVDTTLKL